MVDAVVAALGGGDCERIGSGWLAQPANAVSSLTFVVVGLWLAGRSRVVTGVAMASVGVGSFAYHGPQPGWADAAHNASILALVLVMAGDLVRRIAAAGPVAVLKASRPAAGWIALALLAYWAGRTESPVCSPAALAQPHAAWHALIAIGLGSYDRKEKIRPNSVSLSPPRCDFRP